MQFTALVILLLINWVIWSFAGALILGKAADDPTDNHFGPPPLK
jgi:hypothetical protein